MFILRLNIIRGRYEEMITVAKAHTEQALKDFVARETVPPYQDGETNMYGHTLTKRFRSGGPLERFNPPDRPECITHIGTADEYAQRARENFLNYMSDIPTV